MARRSGGLGQGLELLLQRTDRENGQSPIAVREPRAAAARASWEFAVLRPRRQRRRRRRLEFTISHPDPKVRPRRVRIGDASLWTVLGLLGADGWELVGIAGRRYFLKRPA